MQRAERATHKSEDPNKRDSCVVQKNERDPPKNDDGGGDLGCRRVQIKKRGSSEDWHDVGCGLGLVLICALNAQRQG